MANCDNEDQLLLLQEELIDRFGELPLQGLLGLAVADEQAEYARQLIDAYNDAQPLVGDEPESYPGTLIC